MDSREVVLWGVNLIFEWNRFNHEPKTISQSTGSRWTGRVVSTGKTMACTVVPTETSGPCPILSSQLATTFRTDIRESLSGQLPKIKLKIIGDRNGMPIPNAEVDLWHCNAYVNCSGYTTTGKNGSVNAAGENWLRARATTNINGEVEFTAIFPGWYTGESTITF